MTEVNYTDRDSVVIELYESMWSLSDLADITPIDDPNHRLLRMVSDRVQKAVLSSLPYLHSEDSPERISLDLTVDGGAAQAS